MMQYDPGSLPYVTSVQIVDLRSIDANRVSEYMCCAKNATVYDCDPITSDLIAETWRRLPIGEMVRCHTPPIGLRFYIDNTIVCEGSVCWACENIFGNVNGSEFCYTFDPKSKAGLDLFKLVQSIVGPDVLPDQKED